MAKSHTKTKRPEELKSPHRGTAKTKRKTTEIMIKEEPSQDKSSTKSSLPYIAHPSKLFDCRQHISRPSSWKEDGLKVTFKYVKTMIESQQGYLKLKSNKWHFVPSDPTQRIHKFKKIGKMARNILIGWYDARIFEYFIQWTQENHKKLWYDFRADGKLEDLECEEDEVWELLQDTDEDKRWCYTPSESEHSVYDDAESMQVSDTEDQVSDTEDQDMEISDDEVIILDSQSATSEAEVTLLSTDDNKKSTQPKPAQKSTPTIKEKPSTITPPQAYKDVTMQPKPNSFLLLKKCREVNELKLHSNNSQSTGEAGSSSRTLYKVQLGIWVPANQNNYEEVTKCMNKFLKAVQKIEGGDKNAVKVAKFTETQPNKDLLTTFGEGKYPGKQLETYILNVRSQSRDKAGTQYIRINLSVMPTVDFKTLLKELNTGDWGDRPKQFIRMAPSKCNEPVLIGFLLRSHWTMTATSDMTDFHMMNSGLRLGFIPKEIKYGNGKTKESREIARYKQAQYVECEKKDLKKVMRYCRSEWPTKNKKHSRDGPSLGYKCAFIAIRNESGNLLPKNERLEESVIEQQIATTQKLFVVESHTGFLTAQLDYEFELFGAPGTLRQFIATLQTLPDENGKTRDLFQAISRGEKSNQVHFIMLKPFAEEGRNVINALPLIVREELLLEPNQFFTEETVSLAMEGTWDPIKRIFLEYGEIQNKEALDDGFDDIPGLKEALEERNSDKKHLVVNLPESNEEPMTSKALKNFHRAMNEDDETATYVNPNERVIKRLSPMGKEGAQAWVQKVPNAPPVSIDQQEASVESSITGGTRESKLNRQYTELTTKYNAVIEEKDKHHQKELQEMKAEQEKMRKMIAELLNSTTTKVGPRAGEGANDE